MKFFKSKLIWFAAIAVLVIWIATRKPEYSPINIKTGEDGQPGLFGGNITGAQSFAYRGITYNESSAS